MLEALDIHHPEHPGLLRHTVEGHRVMAPQVAPIAGIQGAGAEQSDNNIQERGHDLPTAGGIVGKQVGPGGTDRIVTT